MVAGFGRKRSIGLNGRDELWRAAKPVAEELENRTLLTASLSATIPSQIDPNTIIFQQQLFPQGTSTSAFSTPAQVNLPGKLFIRFALDNLQEGQTTTFSTSAPAGGVDTALALYDSDGNLLQKTDADQPVLSSESLSAVLASGRPYELGMFFESVAAPNVGRPFTLTATVPPQVQNPTLKIDPTSGALQFQANSGENTFNSPTDVDYYPLDFTNAGASGTVIVKSAASDTRFTTWLYELSAADGTWQPISAGSGTGPLTMNVTPPPQGFLTGAQYMLALSPLNFNSPAEPYEVDLSAPVLGPASVAGQTLSSPLNLAPTSLGTAGASVSQTFSAPALFPFRAVDNGPVTITLNANVPPLLSIYDSTGNNLLAVAASQAGGSTVTATIQATKGQQFIARAGVSSGSPSGQMTLSVSQPYTPTALTATSAVQQQSHLAVAPATGGQFFRITPPAGASYLLLQLTPDSGSTIAPQIVAVSTGLGVVQATGTAGHPASLQIDLSQASGPIDVYVVGTSGTGTATLSFNSMSVPKQVALGQFATQTLDVKTAGLTASVPVPSAGNLAGVQFYEFSPGQSQTITATSSSGAPLLLLRYVQSGGTMQLEGTATGSGSTGATMTADLQGTLMYAIAAMPLGPATGTIQFQVTSPTIPQGVGASMAPNKIAIPNQPPPTAPFAAQLKLSGQVITSLQQRDLFETILPFNMTASPTLSFTPNTIGGPPSVKITVLDSNNNTLNTFTTTAGQALAPQTLSTLTTANAGQTVRLLVEPVAGSVLGDGTYSLEMDVATSDPNPFLLTQSTIADFQYQLEGDIPFGGSATGAFPTPPVLPGFPGPAIQVFRVHLPDATTPFKIWTQDIDPTINTDIKIYRNNFIDITSSELDEFPDEPAPSFDYVPGNRSQIDAQVVVNNWHILDHAYDSSNYGQFDRNNVYVAVMNEQGSQGRYRIFAGPVTEPQVGPGTPSQPLTFGDGSTFLTIDPTTGTGTIFAQTSVLNNEAVVLNTPHGLTTAPITLSAAPASRADTVTVAIFDASHNKIFQQSLGSAGGPPTFTLPQLAPASGYTLHLTASDGQPLNNVTLHCTVSTSSAATKPATTDQLTGGSNLDAYVRAVPAPDGTFSDSQTVRGFGLGPVTVRKVAFDVTSAGPAHFSLAESGLTGVSFALYSEESSGGEFGSIFSGNLLDFVSQAGSDGTYSFDYYLTPGVYALKVVGTFSGLSHTTTITASTPAYDATQITLDPSTGQNDVDNLQTLEPGYVATFASEADYFGTSFYEVTAPGGVQGPLSLDVHNLVNNTGMFDIGVFKRTATGYVKVGSTVLNLNASPAPTSVSLQTTDTPAPGDQYFISVNHDLAGSTGNSQISLGPSFMIPQPGAPDLVPTIQLLPDNGKTRVVVTVHNFGFGAAGSTHGSLVFSNYPTPSDLSLSGVGPFGSVSYITDWSPGSTSDTVTFTADSTNVVAESNEADNSTTVALSTVDSQAPTATLTLSDPSLNGEGATWGRYVSGVSGVSDHILLAGTDNDIYSESLVGGPLSVFFTDALNGIFVNNHTLDVPVDFGSFQPTSASSPNILNASVTDAYGLSTHISQKVDVTPKPQFLTSITFDPAAKKYNLSFTHDVVNEQETLSQLLGFDLPVVGDKNNQFLVHIEAKGTASLNPTQAISLPLTGHILLDALGQSLYDESFNGTDPLTDHLTFSTRLDIDSHTMDVTAASASLQLKNLQLLHFRTPQIKLFSFGLPGIASIDGSIKFGLDASLSAGVKLGIDPNILVDPLSLPDRFGVMSPTYIHPTITGTATAEGDVDVAGFDVASLSGTVSLTLDAVFGLDNNNPATVFSFDDFFNHLALKLTGDLKVNLDAEVAIIGSVWSYNKDFPFTLLNTTTQGIIENDPSPGGSTPLTVGQLQSAIANPLSIVSGATPFVVPAPNMRHGTDLVGAYPIDPHPALVIDPVSGRALAIQVVNGSATPATQSIGNLSFSQRNAGVWSTTPTNLTPNEDTAEPSLALTHDSSASTAAAVAVYEATNVPGSPDGLTLNQKLDDTDIRYQYYNGSGFLSEHSITSDGLLDLSPSASFDALGKGVVAWAHNTNSTVMDANGNYSRNMQDIQAAIWNATTHTFGSPLAVSVPNDGKADYAPATFVDDAGKMYVVWISGAADNNVLMFSTSTGGAWSAPQQLQISGLTPGGSFKNVSIGRDELGRINVIFSYRDPIAADGSVNVQLLDRATTAAAFAQTSGYEVIDQNANYSDLQTTNEPDGSLVAYWQKGDGVDNGVFYSSLSRSSTNPTAPWTAPIRLTSTSDLTMAPSLAIDTNGHMDVLFHEAVPDGGQPAPPSADPQVGVTLAAGVGGSSIAQLPELTFSNGLFFPNQDLAVAGSNATGQATILNSGPVAAQVTIDSYVGLPTSGTKINTQTITLGPGSTYNYSQAFPVSAGSQTYSVHVTSATGEAVTTDDDTSTATLVGLPDLTIASFTGPNPPPAPGQSYTLTADVKNLSSAAIPAFDVTLYSGDPRFPNVPATPIATQHVPGIGASGDVILNFPLTAANTAGNYLFTVFADSGNVVQESVESNNTAQFAYRFAADPAVTSVSAAPGSGNTVTVTVNVANNGNVPVVNAPVLLQVSTDGSDFQDLDAQNVSIPAGQAAQLTFQEPAHAGDSIYRAMFGPSVDAFDSDITNNVGQTELVTRGVADFSIGSLSLSIANPLQRGPLNVNGVLSNSGLADGSNVLVEVFANRPGSLPLLVGSFRIPSVPAGGQVNVSLPVDTTNLSGAYTLSVQVNRLQDILESSVSNNSASIPVTFGAALAINNVVNAVGGVANTITFRRDVTGAFDWVWVNVPATGNPTQLLRLAQPSTVGGSGQNDTLVLDTSDGDPLPTQLLLNGSFTTGALAINAGESIMLAHTTSVNVNHLNVTSLSIAANGTLNLTDGSMAIHFTGASPLATIQGYLRGGGVARLIGSPMPANMALADVPGISVVTVTPRVIGDVNGDNTVNFSDLLALAQHYGQSNVAWDSGDFNYDGSVGFADLLALAQNYGGAAAAAQPGLAASDSLMDLLSARARRR